MDTLQIIILALVQGVTEFLPISSSAHLILVPQFMNLRDQGLLFDVALHGGTLLAIIIYLREDISEMAKSITDKSHGEGRTLLIFLFVGTIPVGLAGLIFHDYISVNLRTPVIIAVSSIVWAFALYIGDKKTSGKTVSNLTMTDVVLIGLSQMIALIPGTSRSGITMTAALFLGLNRVEAARFSFLLSIPVIALATALEIYKYIKEPSHIAPLELLIGFTIAFGSAFLTVKFFITVIKRLSFTPFVAYRVLLGVVILIFVL